MLSPDRLIIGELAGIARRVVTLRSRAALSGFPVAGLKSIDTTVLKFARADFGGATGARDAVGGDRHCPGWLVET